MKAHQACINNDQACEIEDSETDSATQLVNPDDSSLHTQAQQPGSETATHPLQPPIRDIEPNVSKADCLNKELAAECLHTPNDSQRKWTNHFNSVRDSIMLGETSTELIEEAKTIHQRTEAPHTQTQGATANAAATVPSSTAVAKKMTRKPMQ